MCEPVGGIAARRLSRQSQSAASLVARRPGAMSRGGDIHLPIWSALNRQLPWSSDHRPASRSRARSRAHDCKASARWARSSRSHVARRASRVRGHAVEGHLRHSSEIGVRLERRVRPALAPVESAQAQQRACPDWRGRTPGETFVRRASAVCPALELVEFRLGEGRGICLLEPPGCRRPEEQCRGLRDDPRVVQQQQGRAVYRTALPQRASGVRDRIGQRADDGVRCGCGSFTVAFGKQAPILLEHEQAEPCERHSRRDQHQQEKRHQPP
jgi:hypothetical protein